MEFPTFTEGVEDGGIRDSLSGKILLCYLLNHGGDMTFEDMNQILQEHGWMNYFSYTESIAEMEKDGFLQVVGTENNSPIYHVTEKGASLAAELESNVSYALRQRALRAAIRLKEWKYRTKGCTTTMEKLPNGYSVTCTVGDGMDDLMKLSLYVPEKQMGDWIKERFSNDPLTIYRGLMELLDKAAPKPEE